VTADLTYSFADMAAVADHLSEQLATPPLAERCRDRWPHQSLSRGAAGVAVLHGTRAQAGHDSPKRAHAWLSLAVRDGVSAGPGTGLWFGAPAVAFAIAASAPGHYRTATQALDRDIAYMAQARLRAANHRIAAAARPPLSEFDLVRGLTGLGAYFLHCDPGSRLLRQVLRYLVRLTEPVPADDAAGIAAPGWWSGDDPNLRTRTDGGHANLGMAHGIAGPLALLALAARRGITVTGQAEAIDRICALLDAWQQPGTAGPWWPAWITLPDLRDGRTSQPGPARPSWCYGTPGLARAQQLAAIARHDRTRQADAENALARCVSDPAQTARLSQPGLCHGWAGTLATTWHAARDAPSSHLDTATGPLARALAESAHGDHPYGLINGYAGAALILHAIASQAPGRWGGCLLIT
jgi:hypothetical protein